MFVDLPCLFVQPLDYLAQDCGLELSGADHALKMVVKVSGCVYCGLCKFPLNVTATFFLCRNSRLIKPTRRSGLIFQVRCALCFAVRFANCAWLVSI